MVTPGSTTPAFRDPTPNMVWPNLLLRLLLLLTLLSAFWTPIGAGAARVSFSVFEDNRMPGYRKTRLRCDDNLIWKPKRYVWSTSKGVLPRFAKPMGNWLLFKSSKEDIYTTIICRVSNARGTVKGKLKLRIPGFSSEQSESDVPYKILFYVVMGFGIVVHGLLICFWCLRKCCQKQYRASTNVQNRLNRVPPEVRWQRPLADTEAVLEIGVAAVLETNPSGDFPEGSPLHQSNWRGEFDDDNDEGIFEWFCDCLQICVDEDEDEN